MTRATISPETRGRVQDLASALVLDTDWTDDAYLAMSSLNRLIELSDHKLVIHAMPTPTHQRIVRNIVRLLEPPVDAEGGEVLFAPVPVQLWPGKFREPDVMAFRSERRDRIGPQFCRAPDLAIEVLSPGSDRIDRDEKRDEYARSGISEYWLVDPVARAVTVLTAEHAAFEINGVFTLDQRIRSSVFAGVDIAVADVFMGL